MTIPTCTHGKPSPYNCHSCIEKEVKVIHGRLGFETNLRSITTADKREATMKMLKQAYNQIDDLVDGMRNYQPPQGEQSIARDNETTLNKLKEQSSLFATDISTIKKPRQVTSCNPMKNLLKRRVPITISHLGFIIDKYEQLRQTTGESSTAS